MIARFAEGPDRRPAGGSRRRPRGALAPGPRARWHLGGDHL